MIRYVKIKQRERFVYYVYNKTEIYYLIRYNELPARSMKKWIKGNYLSEQRRINEYGGINFSPLEMKQNNFPECPIATISLKSILASKF